MDGHKELPLIQGLWVGGDALPDLVRISICSFIEQGHPYHLYSYKPFPNLPPGCIRKDAAEILPEKYVYRRASDGSLASFSDWFRYELLKKKGGYYADTDIICLKPFDFDEYFVTSWEYAEWKKPRGPGALNGAVLRTEPGHPMWRLMCFILRHPRVFLLAQLLRKIVILATRRKWRKLRRKLKATSMLFYRAARIRETQGGRLSHQTYKMLAYIYAVRLKRGVVMPEYLFYPVPLQRAARLFNGECALRDDLFLKSYAVHFWNNHMRDAPEARTSHRDSLWEQLRRRYLPD